jgi:hypothetical protein
MRQGSSYGKSTWAVEWKERPAEFIQLVSRPLAVYVQLTQQMVLGTAKRSGGDKLKSLFLLALSTFVFPCMFSIAQIILTFRNHDFFLGGASSPSISLQPSPYFHAAYVFVNNLYIEIIGVLLATIWVSKSRAERAEATPKIGSEMSSIAYRVGGPGSHGINVTTARTHGATSSNFNLSTGELQLNDFNAARPGDGPGQRMEPPKSQSLGHDAV